MKRFILVIMLVLVWSYAAFASEQLRQPLSNDGSTAGADTITATQSGTKTGLDVNVATGTLSLEATVKVDLDETNANTLAIDSNTDPLTSQFIATPVTISAGATDSISCNATSSVYILSVRNNATSTFYAYSNYPTAGQKRMPVGINGDHYSPENVKISIKTLYLFNPDTTDSIFYLECWR